MVARNEQGRSSAWTEKTALGIEWAWWKRLIIRLAFYVASFFMLGYVANGHHFKSTAAVAIVVSAFGLLIHRSLSRDEATGGPFAVKLFVWSIFIEVGIVLCAVEHWRVLDYQGFLGLSLIAFGVGQLAAEVRAHIGICGSVVFLCVLNCVAALVGAFAFGLGGGLLILAAIVLAYPTIGLGTEFMINLLAPRWSQRPGRLLWLGVGGVVLVAGGLVIAYEIGGLRFAVLLAVLIAIGVGMVASNTDADVLFVLFAFAVVWSQIPRGDVDPPQFVDGADKHVIVVLGDSYISGEGARAYLKDTNTRAPEKYDQCRRSVKAWAIQVAKEKDLQLDFVACSGAKAKHITVEGQYVGENPDDRYVPAPDGTNHILSQIELYKRSSAGRLATLDWVFISIGGNDAGFGDLVAECLAPGDCSLDGQRWLNRLHESLEPTIAALYESLSQPAALERLGVPEFSGKVVVVPYPVPIAPKGCGILDSTFTDREHRFLNAFTTQMDVLLERQAAIHGLRFVSEMPQALQSARICDTNAASAAVNYVALNPVGGDIDPTGWVHNSMHPNEYGHDLMTAVMERWLDAPPDAEDPSDVPDVAVSLTDVMKDGTQYCSPVYTATGCVVADELPSSDRLPRAGRHGTAGVGLLVVGAWAGWLAALVRRRQLRDDGGAKQPQLARFLDRATTRVRWLSAGVALVATAAFFQVSAWVVGVSGSYGGAQSDTVAELRDRSVATLRTYYAATWRDLVVYVPVYVFYGIVLMLAVRPTQRRTFTVGRSKPIVRITAAAIAALLCAGLADVVETVLFRTTLQRLVLSSDEDVDRLTVWTQTMTVAKIVLGVTAAGLFVWSVVSRRAARTKSADGTDSS